MADKTIIGTPEAVSLPTPKWATWLFRIVFLLTSAATLIIAGENAIPDDVKVRIFLYMKGADVLVWGIGRALGVKKDDYDTDTPMNKY